MVTPNRMDDDFVDYGAGKGVWDTLSLSPSGLASRTLVGAPRNAAQETVQDALLRYFVMQNVNGTLQSFGPEGKLKRQQLELDVRMKKRALDIPDDTQEFNAQLNSPKNHLLAALGIEFERRLDSPQVIQKSISAMHPLGDLFDVNRPIRRGLARSGGLRGLITGIR